MTRRASDVKKPRCPACYGTESTVFRSKPDGQADDGYCRERMCADCGAAWPTIEVLDLERYEARLRADGLTLADIGLERSDLTNGRERTLMVWRPVRKVEAE